jgi:hypothetical protein
MISHNLEVDAIMSRLVRVERKNHLLMVLVGVLGAILMWSTLAQKIVSAMEPVVDKTIEAQRFVLKDAHGNSRAVLENTDHGSMLTFRSIDGKAAAAIDYSDDGLGISWYVGGKPRNLLQINKMLSVALTDEEGAIQMALTLNSDAHRFDVSGKGKSGGLGLSFPGNTPTLVLSNSGSSPRAVLRAEPAGGLLSLVGGESSSQVSLGVGPEGPGIALHGTQDNPYAALLVLPDKAAIILTDSRGKRLDLAP